MDRSVAGLPTGACIGVAVSGGSDSMALLGLAEAWAARRDIPLLALTVDHQLRSGSAGEAAAVAAHCAARGIAHRVLRWQGGRAVQAEARMARHRLLASALRSAGGVVLLTGHTLDDQLETLLIRARQGSTWFGLGGMDPVSVSPAWPEGRGVFILRPLLGARRQDLRGLLERSGTGWADDPSNLDRRYERVRLRELLSTHPAMQARLIRSASALGLLRQAERRALAAIIEADVGAPGHGVLVWQRRPLSAPRATRLLSLLVQVAAGRAGPPDQAGVRALWQAMSDQPVGRGRTLGGAWIAWTERQAVFSRDPGCAAPPPAPEDRTWDGRYERCDAAGPAAPADRPAFPSFAPPRVLPGETGDWRELAPMRLSALTTSMKS